jgi:hypothetical protein
MSSTKLVWTMMTMAPLLAVGCSDGTDGEGAANDDNLTAGAGVQFTTSVGAVVVDGKRVCTAALVDVDAEAHLGSASLSGRQIVIGGACVGKLRSGVTGVAAFVISRNNVSLATPILAFDFESQAEAGLAVGVLSNQPEDTKPMKLLGADATTTAGASVGTVLRADENGVLVGAAVSVNAGVEFNLVTRCTEFHFKAAAGATVGAAFAANDDGLGAAAIVQVDGELRFAAAIDGGCVVRRIGGALRHISESVLGLAGEFADGLAQSGQGDPLAAYEQKPGTQVIRVRVNKPATKIQIGAVGNVSAKALGIRTFTSSGPANDTECVKNGTQCEIRPIRGGTGEARGFTAGQMVDIEVTLHFGLGRIFIASTSD